MLIEASSIHKAYSDGDEAVEVLRGLSLTVPAGASLAVTGPSGSGKSTLLNLLAGVIQVDDGQLTIRLEHGVFHLHALGERERTAFRRANVGYVFQFFNLIPTLSVGENVALPLELNGRRELAANARALLAEFRLEDRSDAYPASLSGGEQQRVAVARALVMSPPLVLADEPTGNLDAANSEVVASLLFRHARELGSTLVVATHSEAVAELADKRLRLGG